MARPPATELTFRARPHHLNRPDRAAGRRSEEVLMDCSSRLSTATHLCVRLTALLVLGWAGAAQAEDVNVGIIGSITDAPFFIAEAKGYYKDEGLTANLVQFD